MGAQPRVYRIGVILLGGPYAQATDGLREGLRELGFEEGKQYALLVRDAKGDLKGAEAAAKSLETDGVDVIFAAGTSVAVRTMKATKTVPIVFHSGADPVALGLVEQFRKPGGRVTGVSSQSRDLTPKRRARRLKIEIVERSVGSVDELRAALRALKPGEVDAIFYVGDAMVSSQAPLIIETGIAKRLPTMLQEEGSVGMGALASYGVSYRSSGRLAAKHVHRILLGARPGDLPVERLDRLHFAVNLKTAKAIGVTIPKAVLDRADEVIQ